MTKWTAALRVMMTVAPCVFTSGWLNPAAVPARNSVSSSSLSVRDHDRVLRRLGNNNAESSSSLLRSEQQPSNVDGSKSNDALPKLIAFDLDGCLWSPEMTELVYFSNNRGGPFRSGPDGTLLTTGNETVRLLGDVRDILSELYTDRREKEGRWRDVVVAVSSRTDQPDWAMELLDKFTIQTSETTTTTFPLRDVINGPIELSHEDKSAHFQRLSSVTKIAMNDMIFFDNESGNCKEIAKLGVTTVYCPDGITMSLWNRALSDFPTKERDAIINYE